jgi:glycosyltransferase involved in cell wall biosynthesis
LRLRQNISLIVTSLPINSTPTIFPSLKGISVLICSCNGEKRLPVTLKHLSLQKFTDSFPHEVLLVNNGSSDCTAKVASETWENLKVNIPLRIVEEKRKGKAYALDLGLTLARYSYVIICDDDNWLDQRYLQNAFNIMEKNPNIGILGGKGTEECEITPPDWFSKYKAYYAVGEQFVINGEIKHYWPKYRIIWGAGSIINREAFNLIKEKGFSTVLNKKSRSEDVELCFAIWLADYKMWYDSKLTYKHFIPVERLKWRYLIKLVKSVTSTAHQLKPYQILKFTGYNNAPLNSFWMQYICHYWNTMKTQFRSVKDMRILMCLIVGLHRESTQYVNKAIVFYQFFEAIKLWKGYDNGFKKVAQLQSRIWNNN